MGLGGLVSGIGKIAGIATGNVQPNMPRLQQAELLPETKGFVKQRGNEAKLPYEDFRDSYSNEITGNVNRAGQDFLGGGLEAGREASIFEDAIRNREMNKYSQGLNDVIRSAKIQAPAVQGQRAAETVGFMRNDATYALDFANKLRTAQDNRAFARNRAIGNILGVGGAGVGAMTGGAKGAQLGYNIGNQFGGNKGQLSYIGE